ncbi:diguanylate cyclase [Aromatoleum diolicum]|uniref:diguanylate cyclase n=2 Tax=Aromatoleum diolicum TaxID=75796 RepID=A0ABX1QG67_9RHOO|nr:diguanylate cyclase [Aromatoleum diolicum]
MRKTIDSEAGVTVPPDTNDVMVLLVDDQLIIAEAIRRVLADQPNIDFHYCSDPADAMVIARKVKPTVILQDLVMPHVDGLALVRLYRADPATQDIPVIVLSTKEEPAVKREAFAAGANDYLVKLPDSIELIARIRYHSKYFLNQVQRDQAYQALRRSQQQLQEKNLELLRLSNQDGLTGLSNRRYFDEYIEAQWKQAIGDQSPISLLMIDVDDFKRYNDTYGHLAGDDALKQVAAVMRQRFLRPTDLTVRFGGEEFAVILPATPFLPIQSLGEKLRCDVEELAIAHRGSSVGECLTVSVGGTSMIPQSTDTFLSWIDRADKALYQAKLLGKNRVVMHGQDQSFLAHAAQSASATDSA